MFLFSFLPICVNVLSVVAAPSLDQQQSQLLADRLFQTNLRGPRWTGNENQNTLTSSVAQSMKLAGLNVETLDYPIFRWDPRWWSLSLALKNGTNLGLPTTGYWPYSGNSGPMGVQGPLRDGGQFAIDHSDETSDNSTLAIQNVTNGTIIFFDNPSPTKNYSEPGYDLLGTSRNISSAEIPELGNLTNPHWQSGKSLDFDVLSSMGIRGVIASWVNTSDDNAMLQYLPNDGAPGANATYNVPALYVGNSTGELIRDLLANNEVESATVVLDAPSIESTTSTVIGHLSGSSGGDESLLLYTHSDGPSIIEENGPILLLAIAETLAKNPLKMNVDFVITTGHMSGGHVNESAWMDQRPAIMANAKAAIACEHFGAIEWKDDFSSGRPEYKSTGKMEPMWTMANDTAIDAAGTQLLHEVYVDSFDGTSPDLRMAMVAPQIVNGSQSKWYGVGGSSTLGKSKIPMIGIIPQPDYLWAGMPDGGWSKLNISIAVEQINVILRMMSTLDEKFQNGTSTPTRRAHKFVAGTL